MSMWLSRSADAAALHPSTAPILDAATKFLWSDEMQESVDAFTRNYTPLFEGSQGPEGEQKLEWTDAHREIWSQANRLASHSQHPSTGVAHLHP